MRKWSEAAALATLFSNTRCKKRPADLLTVADAINYLVGLYGSPKAVARKVDLSVEMIRQFLTVLELPRTVKALFASRQIDSVDVAKELASLRDTEKQETVARTIVNSPSKDVRDIKRLIKTSRYRVKDAKKTVLNAKPKGLNIFVLDFDDETSRKVMAEARARKMKPAELVREIVTNYLRKKSRGKN